MYPWQASLPRGRKCEKKPSAVGEQRAKKKRTSHCTYTYDIRPHLRSRNTPITLGYVIGLNTAASQRPTTALALQEQSLNRYGT